MIRIPIGVVGGQGICSWTALSKWFRVAYARYGTTFFFGKRTQIAFPRNLFPPGTPFDWVGGNGLVFLCTKQKKTKKRTTKRWVLPAHFQAGQVPVYRASGHPFFLRHYTLHRNAALILGSGLPRGRAGRFALSCRKVEPGGNLSCCALLRIALRSLCLASS